MDTLVKEVAGKLGKAFPNLRITNIYRHKISYVRLRKGKCVGSGIFYVNPEKTSQDNFQNFSF